MGPTLNELVETYTSQLLRELGSRLTPLELSRWQPAAESVRPLAAKIVNENAFRYVDDVRDERRLFVNMTPILCALDTVWADDLHRPAYRVRFERPTTLANGNDACRFQFTKTDDQGGT